MDQNLDWSLTIHRQMMKTESNMRPTNTSSITLGTCIKCIGIIGLIGIIVFYVQFQARNILLGPTIHLNETPVAIHHERLITLTGNARNIVKLTLNGKEIHTNAKGDFAQELILESGYTLATLEAQDRFGRVKTLTQPYVYVPETLPADEV